MNPKTELIDKLIKIAPDKKFEIISIVSKYEISDLDHQENLGLSFRIDSFIASKRIDGLSHTTLQSYKEVLHSFLNKIDKPAEVITTNDVRLYLAHLSDDRKLSNATIQTHISTLRSFFSWLSDEDIIFRNPMKKIRSLRIDRISSRRPLSSEQMEILRDGCVSYKEKALVEFLVSTGCRVSEVSRIKLEDVDWQNRRIIVLGKGNKRREVYFSVRAKVMLDKYIKERPGGESLFSSSRFPYDAMGPRSIQKALSNIGKRIHASRNIHPHLLRHTFATKALSSGMDITTIQHLLGHADLQTTLIYAEINPVKVQYEYNRLIA